MRLVAVLLVIVVLAAICAVLVRSRRQRKAVADHAAAVLRRDWVQELRES
ncbi:MAG: hypothetical protein QOH64_1830 [Acidimicrobiaceae bacterium]|jgi:cell division protein FtsL